MSLEQLDELLARIKIHCPFFMKGYDKNDEKLLKKEWYKILINYSPIDVNKALDEHLQSTKNAPTVHELVDGLPKISCKEIYTNEIIIKCPFCKRKIRVKEYDSHYSKHLSIEYLSHMALKYSKTSLNKNKLQNMEDEEFDKYYWDCCKKILKVVNPVEKCLLENAILSHDGKPLKENWDEAVEQFKKMVLK